MSIGHNITTRHLRADLERHVDQYLASGGTIKQYPTGYSSDKKSGMNIKQMTELDKSEGRTRSQQRGGLAAGRSKTKRTKS